MSAPKEKRNLIVTAPAQIEYRGKRTRTGNSFGFRFEGALFKSHPEFGADVRARIIAPGRMLVTAEIGDNRGEDPVLASFLAFLAQDMQDHPESIKPVSAARMKRAERLTRGVVSDPEERLSQDIVI